MRYLVCRHLFASCGENVNVEAGAEFGSGEGISIGANSGIGVDAFIDGPVSIGADVMIGPNFVIPGPNHRFDDLSVPMIQQGFEARRPVIIEDDVWIGINVILLPGLTVGRGAIVAAGWVVTKDVPPAAIVGGGDPARVLRSRGDDR